MKDPYIQENGTLKNMLGITNYDELNKKEKDICYLKLLNVDKVYKGKFDMDLLKAVHKHIFEDIYDWAGEFRTVPLYKTEIIIPGISLEYANPKNIKKELQKNITTMNNFDWDSISDNKEEVTKHLVRNMAKIWRVHPFRDGNTRTILAYATIFAKEHNFELDISKIASGLTRIVNKDTNKVVKWSIRDKFVLSALDEDFYPEPEGLEREIKKSMIDKKENENGEER